MSEMMTAEQAASKLTNIMHDDHYAWHPSILTAFSMAVDALRGADGDCISRQAAIEIVDFECGEWRGLAKTIIKKIEDMPSVTPKAEQRWIPWDSGKFPEESGTYIVTAYDGATKRVTYAKYQKRLKRWELTGARAYWRVLAWQPLPEPYREEGEAE